MDWKRPVMSKAVFFNGVSVVSVTWRRVRISTSNLALLAKMTTASSDIVGWKMAAPSAPSASVVPKNKGRLRRKCQSGRCVSW